MSHIYRVMSMDIVVLQGKRRKRSSSHAARVFKMSDSDATALSRHPC